MLETGSIESSRLAEVLEELDSLKRRVATLEQKLGVSAAAEVTAPGTATSTPAAEMPSTNLVAVLGRALLGIAGAYLLRAVFESGVIPAGVGAAATIVYAMWWLRVARDAATRDPVSVNVYAATAAAIVYPMLWETTVRFQASAPAVTAAVLVLFVAAGFAAAWKANLGGIVWITTLGSIATALGLLLATRHVVAFAAALLAIAAVVEIGACRDHWLQLRGIASFAAALSAWLAIYLIGSPRGLPESYAPFTANHAILLAIVFLAVALGGTMVRTLIRRLDITRLEVVQLAMAIALAVGGSLRIGGPAGRLWTGVAVTAGAVACYLVSFLYLDRAAGKNRNFYTYSTLALILATSGTFILMRGSALTALWAVAAAAATWIGASADRTTVRLHGIVYLLLAGVASSAFAASLRRIVGNGTSDGAPWTAAYTITLAGAVFCYAISMRRRAESPRDAWATFGVAAMLLLVIAGLAAGFVSPISTLPLRTALLAAAALALAVAGARWSRQELTWLVYPCMVLAAFRMAARDFPQGNTAGFALALLSFGGALMLLPRVLRAGRA